MASETMTRMADTSQESGPNTYVPPQCAAQPPRRAHRWLLLALLAGGAAFAVWWWGLFGRPGTAGPLDGELTVAVRPAGRGQQKYTIDEPDALPVRAGGWMSLEVNLNQPAYVYLVWLDCDARAVPLYPWNNDDLE